MRFKPAQLYLDGLHRLALAEVSGLGGDDVADLVSHELGRAHQFQVVDRSQVYNVFGSEPAARLGDREASRLGQQLNAQALIFGRITRNDFQDSLATEASTTAGVATTTLLREGVLRLRAFFRVVDVQSGKLLGSDAFSVDVTPDSKSIVYRGSADEALLHMHQLGEVDIEALRLQAYEAIARAFVDHITPHYERVSITLYSDRHIPESQTAITAARAGDWQLASELYRLGVEFADKYGHVPRKYHARAHYNYGMSLAMAGRFDDGLNELQLAQGMHPNRLVGQSIDRILGFQRDAQLAATQVSALQCKPGSVTDCSEEAAQPQWVFPATAEGPMSTVDEFDLSEAEDHGDNDTR